MPPTSSVQGSAEGPAEGPVRSPAARPAPCDPRPARHAGPWFNAGAKGAPRPAPDELPLVCFPYAGGTPSVYHRWAATLGPEIRVEPLLLPGRGLRLHEDPYTGMAALAGAVADELVRLRLDTGCAFFGHSMGALVAYEVACVLRGRGRPGPVGLLLSGSRAPHAYGDRSDSTLPDAELIALLGDLGGLSSGMDAVRQAFLRRRLPALRADLRACDTYQWQDRAPLAVPLTLFSAVDDPLAPPELVAAWRTYTAARCDHHRLPGGHFALLEEPGRGLLLRELRAECARLARHSAALSPAAPSPATPVPSNAAPQRRYS